MNIQVISDIHSEFHRDGGYEWARGMDSEGVDVLVIAGYLGLVHESTKLELVLALLREKYPEVVYVMGNHEYYHSDIATVGEFRERVGNRYENLHILDNDYVEIGIEGRRFLGSTLWFREGSGGKEILDQFNIISRKHRLNDFNEIGGGFLEWVGKRNEESIEFFRNNIREGDVVLTHHVPSNQLISPKWLGSELNRYFVCDMEDVIEDNKPGLWVYGHTHDSNSMKIGQTEVVCNPMGYIHIGENVREFGEYKKVVVSI